MVQSTQPTTSTSTTGSIEIGGKPFHWETWTCVGRRILSTGRAGDAWLKPDGTLTYFRKTFLPRRFATPGQRYQVCVADDGTSVQTGKKYEPEYLDCLPDFDPRVLEWSMLDRAAATMDRQKQKAQSDALKDRWIAQLEPVRIIYRQQTRTTRRAMLADIMAYLGDV